MDDTYCQRMAEIGRALSDPCRVAILLNFKGRTMSISTITEEMGTYQSNVSYHISILYKADLVLRVDTGRWHYYTVNTEAVSEIDRFMADCKKKAGRKRTADRKQAVST